MVSKVSKLGRECMFSGAVADSEEHVIPRWLQRRFSLSNQEVVLPNQTTFRYAKAKVPVKTEHNRAFGVIENRMAEGIFTLQEAYLWALKIHIGMMWLDARLKRERKDPGSKTILKGTDFSKQVLMFRQLYTNWANGGETVPNPFGSVFLLEGGLIPNEFDLFHCMISGALGISIDHRFLFVLLWDRAEAMQGCALRDCIGHISHAFKVRRKETAARLPIWRVMSGPAKSLMICGCGNDRFASDNWTTASPRLH